MGVKTIPWALAKGRRDGNSLMMRFRQFGQDFPKEEYPVRITMQCDVQEQTPAGLPTRQEYERLGKFEERLMEVVEEDEESVLAMVITSSGKREFVFQTADAEAFKQRLESVYDNGGVYPVSLEQEEDDDWQYVNLYTPRD